MTTRPLDGWRVLVPRGGKWGDNVSALLRSRGAIPVVAPMINFAGTDDAAALTEALVGLQAGSYDWLVVTSATTVDVLSGQSVAVPSTTRVAAVGETTAAALTLAGYRVDFIPSDNSARGLVKEWPDEAGRALIPQSDLAEPTLVEGLAERGLEATFVAAYRTVGVAVEQRIRDDVASGRIGAMLVSSGSVARQMAAQFVLPESTVVACIGPRTAFDARAAGLIVDVIADERSVESLVDAMVEHIASLA